MKEVIKKGTTVIIDITVFDQNWGEHPCQSKYVLEEDTIYENIWKSAASTASWEAASQFSDDFSFDIELIKS